MHPRRRLLKRIGAGLGLVGSSVLLSKITPPIYAQSTPVEIEPGSFVSPADYIVFEKDGEYYARNGRTGEIDFGPETDASQVIQPILDKGGSMLLKKGVYECYSQINVTKSNIRIIGEGKATILDFSNITTPFTGIDIEGKDVFEETGSFIEGVEVGNLTVKGSKTPESARGILAIYVKGLHLWNIWGQDWKSFAFIIGHISHSDMYYAEDFYLENLYAENCDRGALALEHCKNGLITGLYGWNTDYRGVWLHYGADADAYPVKNVTIVGCEVKRDTRGTSTLGICITVPAENIVFVNPVIDTWERGFWLAHENMRNVKVYGGRVRNCCDGVIVSGSLNYPETIVFDGVWWDGNDTNVRTDTDAIKCVYRNCDGFVTKNSGVVSLTGDGSTTEFVAKVEHGLVSDKVAVSVSCTKPTTAPPSYIYGYLSDENSDGFKETIVITVRFDTAPADGEEFDIYWRAEVIQSS